MHERCDDKNWTILQLQEPQDCSVSRIEVLKNERRWCGTDKNYDMNWTVHLFALTICNVDRAVKGA